MEKGTEDITLGVLDLPEKGAQKRGRRILDLRLAYDVIKVTERKIGDKKRGQRLFNPRMVVEVIGPFVKSARCCDNALSNIENTASDCSPNLRRIS